MKLTNVRVVNGFMELFDLISKGFFATASPDVATLTYYKGIPVEEFFRSNRAVFNTPDKAAQVVEGGLLLPSKF